MNIKTSSSSSASSPRGPVAEWFYQFFRTPQIWGGFLFALCTAIAAEVLLEHYSPQLIEPADAPLSAGGRIALATFSLFLLHRFAATAIRSYQPRLRDLVTLTTVSVSQLIVIWIGRLVAESLSSYFATARSPVIVPPEAFYFGTPFAAAALLLQAVLGSLYGFLVALSLALILALYSPGTEFFSLYALVTSLTACLSLSRFRSRSANIKAGLYIFVASFPFAIAYCFADGNFFDATTVAVILCTFAGGILCAFVATGTAPIVEHLGGYVTDMRLIEMATLDHPLLKELSIQAPGTWNHSMVMGMMVEAAADSIGANPVLARVGAYFHDCGKLKKPLYFVENQAGAENRHDRLSTSMSALIIRTHVKDGIELSKKHGLPMAIEDMIPQHHGTSRIEYFYDKACKEAEEAGQDPSTVDESLYRYPGPKPQTKEAGILMLADGIEAASRTLPDPSFDRIQGMVQKMINKVFSTGELDECDLTLRDLHQIAKAFTRILSGIYHQRIAYAEPAEKTRQAEEEPIQATEQSATEEDLAGGSANKKPKNQTEEKPAKDPSPENLKRLGL